MESRATEGYDHLDVVVQHFNEFLDGNRELFRTATGEFTHLQDYISHWLERGDAIEITGGDFGTYMRGVVRIIDVWHRNPTLHIERPVEGIFARTGGEVFIDPDYFGYMAMRKRLGR